MIRRVLIALALFACLPVPASAHDLQHSIGEGAAVCVKLFFSDGNAFSFESYELYRAGEEIPFQVGRTDNQGRVVFIPDRPGTWRLKVFSEDGHGVDLSFTTGGEGGVQDAGRPFLERHLRIVVGLSLIFGVFGLVDLFARRRKRS
jgi:nickel transport protein